MHKVQVDDLIIVLWSNGAGHSTYRVVDNPNEILLHLLELVEEWEYTADGIQVEVT